MNTPSLPSLIRLERPALIADVLILKDGVLVLRTAMSVKVMISGTIRLNIATLHELGGGSMPIDYIFFARSLLSILEALENNWEIFFRATWVKPLLTHDYSLFYYPFSLDPLLNLLNVTVK